MIFHNEVILVTRVDEMKAKYILQHYPNLEYHQTAQLISTPPKDIPQSKYYVSVLCAGTSDLPIAEEAALTAEIMGVSVKRFYDVGFQVFIAYYPTFMIYAKGKFLSL